MEADSEGRQVGGRFGVKGHRFGVEAHWRQIGGRFGVEADHRRSRGGGRLEADSGER